MSSSLATNPHIYKKGKILMVRRLNEGLGKEPKNFTFSSLPGNARITTIIASTNNLNQITGRILLGVYKLLSYFGLSKDPSDKFSKGPSVFGKYCATYFYRSESNPTSSNRNKVEEMKNLLIEHNAKILNLLSKNNEEVKKLAEEVKRLCDNKHDIPISRKEVLDFTSKLGEIEEYLRKILG